MSGSPMRAVPLLRPGERTVVRFEPRGASERDAMNNAAIAYAKRAKNFDLLTEAIDRKLDDQQAFVNWWHANVSVNHGGRLGASNADRRSWSVAAAERTTGIRQQQVSKWVQRLQDRDLYRERLLGAVCRRATRAATSTTLPRPTDHRDTDLQIGTARR